MEKTFEADIECQSCNGTGLYVGLCERDGAAVVCHTCKGTGKYHYKFTFTKFIKRKNRNDVTRVFANSAGYVHSANDVVTKDGQTIRFSSGGIDYKGWLDGGKPEPMRELYCPLQFTSQTWHSPLYCKDNRFGLITQCPKRCDMAECWKLYDEEQAGK